MAARRVCLALLLSLVLSSAQDVPVPRYTVNLDSPAEERFLPVCRDMREVIPTAQKLTKDMIKYFFKAKPENIPIVEALARDLDQYLPQPYAGEMRGIARCMEMDLGEVVLVNFSYDFFAYCTSILVQDSAGTIWHGRNFDWEALMFTEAVRNVTVTLDFQTMGQTLYTATTYLGYVGVVTGQRPNNFTISVNQRDSRGMWWMNALEAILNRRASFVGFLVRETLEDSNSYGAAIQKLAYTPLIAPSYIIVAGTDVAEGAVIARDRTSALDIWTLNPSKGRWYLIEGGVDHWDPPTPGWDKRTPAQKFLNSTGQAGINTSSMFQVMSVNPVLNNGTVFTTIMSASQPQVYNAWTRWS